MVDGLGDEFKLRGFRASGFRAFGCFGFKVKFSGLGCLEVLTYSTLTCN